MPGRSAPGPLDSGKVLARSAASPKAYDHFCRARLALEDNDLATAIEEYKLAIVYDHDSSYLFTNLAKTYYRAGDAKHAEEASRRAIVLDERALEARMLLAAIYGDRRDIERAEAEYKAILLLDPALLPREGTDGSNRHHDSSRDEGAP